MPTSFPLFEAGFDDEYFYIATAFIEGVTLKEDSQRKPRDHRRAATIVANLADALDYAHQQGIVHRDVKPANIMIDEQGEPQLMDFGLARLQESADQVTQDGSVLGTPAYMSPEQASGKTNEMGPASDQYSLGVVMYELLCGERPFNGPPALVISLVCNQDPSRPRELDPQIPAPLERICLRAMSKRIEDRYASLGEMAEEINNFLSENSRTIPVAIADAKTGAGKPPPLATTSAGRPPAIETTSRPALPSRKTKAGLPARLLRPPLLYVFDRWQQPVLLIAMSVVVLIFSARGKIEIQLANAAGPVSVKVDGETVASKKLGAPLKLRAGKHQVEISGEDIQTHRESFRVVRGKNPVLTIRLTRDDSKNHLAVKNQDPKTGSDPGSSDDPTGKTDDPPITDNPPVPDEPPKPVLTAAERRIAKALDESTEMVLFR